LGQCRDPDRALQTSIREDGGGWAVSDRPTLVIATDPVDQEHVVHWIRGAVRLSDGRIAAISESSKDLRFYDSAGALTQVVGREGDGPGEFRSPFHLDCLLGDTLVVSERGGTRRSWFSPTGEFIRVVTPDREPALAVIPPDFSLGGDRLVPPTFALWEVRQRDQPVTGRRWRKPRGYLLARVDGQDPKILGWFKGWERFAAEEGTTRQAFFARNTWVASSVDPPRIIIGDSESFDLRVFDLSGELVQIIRDAIPQRPIEDTDIEWERWEVLSFAESFGGLPGFTRFADAMPIPDQKPAFEALIVDSEGHLWVKEYSSYRPNPVQYRIYSPQGIRVGTVMLPGRLRVFEIGFDYVLGLHADLDHVETIQIYSLRRPGENRLNF
jgi:hypothetical protein